jgi:putative ABC transport system substrate-binding protein
LKRRRLILALGASALAGGVAAQRRSPRVVLLSPSRRGLFNASDIGFEARSAEAAFGELDRVAAALVRERPDVVVAQGTAASVAAAKATQRVPIVTAPSWQPVSGANVTGLVVDAAQLAARLIELVRELKSNARRIALLAHADDASNRSFLAAMIQAAARIRVPVGVSRVRTAEDYEAVFAQWERLRLQALVVHPSVDVNRVAELALRYRLPAIALSSGFVEAGGLMSYSENRRQLVRRTAGYVERIVKGAKPAALPVEPLGEFDLALNLKTARALELEFPDSVLARADAILQ